ncbi:SlyX family protein [candidate division KSB1 bacterium]|nr:SlyX family protein [candidate division KSB1 bacterium]
MEQRIEELEKGFLHQEKRLIELDEGMKRQQRLIDQLMQNVVELSGKLKALGKNLE